MHQLILYCRILHVCYFTTYTLCTSWQKRSHYTRKIKTKTLPTLNKIWGLHLHEYICIWNEGPQTPTHVHAYITRVCESALQTSLSGTFLQTQPELVLPLKGHYLVLRTAFHWHCQHPLQSFGTEQTAEATQHPSTHVNMKCFRPR